MEIVSDFDGVIADSAKLKRKVAKKMFGIDIDEAELKSELIIAGHSGITIEQYREIKKMVYFDKCVGLTLESIDGSLEYISRFLSDGHSLIIATSRSGLAEDIAREWLNQRGIEIPVFGVGYTGSKADVCAGKDVIVDDDIYKLEPLVDVVRYRFLFTQGHNRTMTVKKDIAERVNDWPSLYERISDLN